MDSSVLLVPHKTNEELKLKEQGFSSAYVRGIDKVNEWISVVNQLRKLKVNPYKTHIEYFVGSIEAHIERVREGLDPSNVYALRTLERLKRHAERTVQREEVTYYWWLRFNYALSKVSDFTMSNADIMRGRSILRGVERNNLVNRFPAYIVMPTIIGKMGVMAINRANQADIYIGGLISGKGTGHGEELVSPEWFFDHDISTHAVNAINGKSTYRDNDHSERYDLLVEKMGSLTGEKRKHVELAFYILMHERGDAAFLEKRFLYIQSLIHSTLSAQIYNKFNFRGLLDTSSNERIAEQIREVVDDFMEIVKEVKDPAEPEVLKILEIEYMRSLL